MEFILDMVHHNPGEPPFQTMFTEPETLVDYGYNGQVFKHVNCALTFEGFDKNVTPTGSPEWVWIQELRCELRQEITAAKKQGLSVFFHIDLFVLPVRLVEKYRDRICGADGRISLDASLTLEVHRALFRELFQTFPEIDGLIIRVGETYLYDTPYHVGNGPIRAGQYEAGRETDEEEQERYVKLITFLKEEICETYDRYLMFRTWDCFPDKFHARADYYLAVTDQIRPHNKLLFSVKHTALDFWRRVCVNPCIGIGYHRQIIEVQCQREYEGKGAYPDYIMDGVINGFPECRKSAGLKDFLNNSLVCGIYAWSRGGGWYGPYLKNELWCSLHAYVIAGWARNPQETEETLFYRFCLEKLGMSEADAQTMRQLCRTASEAVLCGRYCEAYDEHLQEKIMPTNLWMRDDRLGGMEQIKPILDYLEEHGLLDAALQEKKESVKLWEQVAELAGRIQTGNDRDKEYIRVSAEYGLALYRIVYTAWNIWIGLRQGSLVDAEKQTALEAYEKSWKDYEKLTMQPQCATLYEGRYLNLPGTEESIGMWASLPRQAYEDKK